MSVFFTADLHLGHKNIIQHCNRPFADVDEMNAALIKNWNSKVHRDDTVYIVGDFAVYPRYTEEVLGWIAELKGRKIFIIGSHDDWIETLMPELRKIPDTRIWSDRVLEFRKPTTRKNQRDLVLCHWGMRSWPGSNHGVWHLFGHSHGHLPPHGKSFDIGVDCHNYFPLSYEEVEEKMDALPSWDDGHTRRGTDESTANR